FGPHEASQLFQQRRFRLSVSRWRVTPFFVCSKTQFPRRHADKKDVGIGCVEVDKCPTCCLGRRLRSGTKKWCGHTRCTNILQLWLGVLGGVSYEWAGVAVS
ncbi:unnamed protein product, partial [Ectocarpus sp. 12 AP-2014]